MKRLPVALPACILAFLFGCEHTAEEVELPFKERLVVYGDIEGAVNFERTLPLNTVWNEDSSRLQDVNARIVFQGASFPLRLDSVVRGLYRGYVLPEGADIELQADWRGKKVTARVKKPTRPQIDTLWMSVDSSMVPPTIRCGGTYVATENVAYFASISVRMDTDRFEKGWRFLKGDDGTSGAERIQLAAEFPFQAGATCRVYMIVDAYDRAYYDYHLSEGYGSLPPTSLFSGSIRSNIKGDGIGIVWANSSSSRVIQ
ncbi:MAG: hypothetical protein HY961_07580 [Ignavibacteriae bacterium]|nr:hypothetical protein [Ignavibacteriota bacterium]